jgi:hypothetical protein
MKLVTPVAAAFGFPAMSVAVMLTAFVVSPLGTVYA